MESTRDLPLLLVRADAGETIGTGHVMRCLALACAWAERGGRVEFLSVRPTITLCARYEKIKAAIIDIDEAYPHAADLAATVSRLQQSYGHDKQSPWVALDGYHFDTNYQSRIRSAGSRLIVIDDTAELPFFDADVVLNHALQAPNLAYHCNAGTRLLLGTQFALLRPEFQRWSVLNRGCPEVARNILVSLGGGDKGNTTLKVIEALKALRHADIAVRVVVGPLNGHLQDLRRAIDPVRGSFRIETDIVEVAPLMAWADLAIAAGGTTSWELAFMKVPALVFEVADNQSGVVRAVDSFGCARSLGNPDSLGVDALAESVLRLMRDAAERRQMSEKGRILVDGRGSLRVVDTMVSEAGGPEFDLHAATTEDALLLWQWANDPVARRNSFTSEPILWSLHDHWCRQKIGSEDTRWWILEYRRIPVGQIRYDRTNLDTALISFSIAAAHRGRGFGAKLLDLTADLAARELNVGAVEGVAFADNFASRRAFAAARFEPIAEKEIAGHDCVVFRRSCARGWMGDFHAAQH